MHDLQIIKALNAQAAESAQSAKPVGFDSAGNRGGIQGHSQGPVFPIVEYQVGGNGRPGSFKSKAPFSSGAELGADDYAGQRENSKFLLQLEVAADAACDELARSNGFSVSLSGFSPESGYTASEAGSELQVSPDRPYAAVYQYLFDHADHLRSGGFIGGWVHDGRLYLDCSYNFADRDHALQFAACNNQLAIWDVVSCAEIAVSPDDCIK